MGLGARGHDGDVGVLLPTDTSLKMNPRRYNPTNVHRSRPCRTCFSERLRPINELQIVVRGGYVLKSVARQICSFHPPRVNIMHTAAPLCAAALVEIRAGKKHIWSPLSVLAVKIHHWPVPLLRCKGTPRTMPQASECVNKLNLNQLPASVESLQLAGLSVQGMRRHCHQYVKLNRKYFDDSSLT